jgi:two-component system sensor histidine kinase ChiS
MSFKTPYTQPEQNSSAATKGNTTITILAIDDEESCLMVMEIYLERLGYNVLKASSGQEALEIMSTHHDTIHLILLDLMMFDIYGLDLLAQIKSSPSLSHVPVILQTGSSNNKELARAFEMGIVAVLSKPYNKAELAVVLEKALKQHSKHIA